MCFVTMKTSDNHTKIAKCSTCLGPDGQLSINFKLFIAILFERNIKILFRMIGNILKESTKIDVNVGNNRTDVTSINIINLNSTNDKEFLNTVAAVVKGLIAKNAGTHVPYVQVTTPSTATNPIPTAPNQISTIQGIPPTNQIIIVQPSTPQIIIRDGQFDSSPREYFGKF